jgi:hypothetical protein
VPLDVTLPTAGESPWDVKLNTAITDITEFVNELEASSVLVTAPNVFTATQTFDAAQGWNLGSKLQFRYADGFFGQRVELSGTDSAVMPYLDIVATSLTGTDVGGATGGLQLHRLPGGGAAANREFLAFEVSGDLATVPGFKISPWASGTGQLRPITFWDGTHEVFRIVNEGGTGALRLGEGARLTLQDTTTTSRSVVLMQRNGTYGDQRRVYSSTGATRPYIVLMKNRGTIAAPTMPASGDTFGGYEFGSTNAGNEVIGSYMRSSATETWVAGSAQGAKLTFATTPAGSTTVTPQLDIDEPVADTEVALLVRVNRAGVKTLSRVSIGAVDSAGTGFRALRVAN